MWRVHGMCGVCVWWVRRVCARGAVCLCGGGVCVREYRQKSYMKPNRKTCKYSIHSTSNVDHSKHDIHFRNKSE